MTVTVVPTVQLNSGRAMPNFGLGTWKLSDDQAQLIVGEAINIGYRMFDTSDQYRNEAGIGRAVAESGLPRDELFVTSKVWAADGYDSTLRAFDASMIRLGFDVIDLYLMHWPRMEVALTKGAWRAFERLLNDGRCRSIGVSNFKFDDLTCLLSYASTPPSVNQIQLNPWCPQAAQRTFHNRFDIITQAWGPLGRGRKNLDSPILVSIASKYGRSPAQIVLRWSLQLGNSVIPKTGTFERLQENISIFDFDLDEYDIYAMSLLDERLSMTEQSFEGRIS